MYVCVVPLSQTSDQDFLSGMFCTWDEKTYIKEKNGRFFVCKFGKCLANQNITKNTILGVLSKLFSPKQIWSAEIKDARSKYIWRITMIGDPLKFISSPAIEVYTYRYIVSFSCRTGSHGNSRIHIDQFCLHIFVRIGRSVRSIRWNLNNTCYIIITWFDVDAITMPWRHFYVVVIYPGWFTTFCKWCFCFNVCEYTYRNILIL